MKQFEPGMTIMETQVGIDLIYSSCQGWRKQSNFRGPHLSKGLRYLKQNGTQEKKPFSGAVLRALLHDVIRFVVSVSYRYHLLNGRISSTANQKLLYNGFGS